MFVLIYVMHLVTFRLFYFNFLLCRLFETSSESLDKQRSEENIIIRYVRTCAPGHHEGLELPCSFKQMIKERYDKQFWILGNRQHRTLIPKKREVKLVTPPLAPIIAQRDFSCYKTRKTHTQLSALAGLRQNSEKLRQTEFTGQHREGNAAREMLRRAAWVLSRILPSQGRHHGKRAARIIPGAHTNW